MSANIEVHPNLYGQLAPPQRSGLFGFSLGQSIALVPIVLIVISLLAFQLWLAAFALVVVTSVGFAFVKVYRKDGRSIYGRIMLRLAQKRKEKTNQHIYLAGPTGKGTPDGKTRLPGLMARSELSEHADSFGEPFGLIRVSGNGVHNYSVVFETHPAGEDLIDPDQMQHRIALWAAWLTQRGADEGIRGASVTIESSPDSGLRLRSLIQNNKIARAHV